jgi:hypothetical protein
MFRFLLIFFLLIFLGIDTNNSRQLVFSLDEQSDEENSDNSDGEASTEESSEESADSEPEVKAIPPQVRKKQVRSIVDNVLSINKHIDHTKKRKKSKKRRTDESEEEDSTEEDSTEEDSEEENSAKKGSVKEAADADDDDDNDDDDDDDGASEKKKKSKKKKGVKNKSKSKSKRRKKSGESSDYSSKRIYTVKNMYLPRNATNRYLSRSYRSGGYGGSGEYRIKSYGSSDNNAKYVPKSYANVKPKEEPSNVKSEEEPPGEVKPEENENANPPEEKSKSVSQCFSSDGCHR